jgi:hypothetical protein
LLTGGWRLADHAPLLLPAAALLVSNLPALTDLALRCSPALPEPPYGPRTAEALRRLPLTSLELEGVSCHLTVFPSTLQRLEIMAPDMPQDVLQAQVIPAMA